MYVCLLLFPYQILYTGDYSREVDRHLMAAEIPEVRSFLLASVPFCWDSFFFVGKRSFWLGCVPFCGDAFVFIGGVAFFFGGVDFLLLQRAKYVMCPLVMCPLCLAVGLVVCRCVRR